MRYFSQFDEAVENAISSLKKFGTEVDTGRWQGTPTEGKPDLVTKELLNLQFAVPLERASWHDETVQSYAEELALEIKPNLPWADEHFAERVGGVPMNPDPSYQNWPWWHGGFQEAKSMIPSQTETGEFKFTHTYSERFWPKSAGYFESSEGLVMPGDVPEVVPAHGIRYDYGDYSDVLDLLAEDPYTRQAYLPIFFPEDTGAVHRGRIPCSLGYHFLLRSNKLHCWYDIRSCDAVRHFRDDLYLAARLVAHTIEQLFERAQAAETESSGYNPWLEQPSPGTLYFTAHSFHVHMGDYHRL